MLAFNDLEYKKNQITYPERLDFKTNLLIQAATAGKSTNALKVMYFKKILNFVRVLSLYIISKNDFKNTLSNWNSQNIKSDEKRILKSFMDMLLHFDIILDEEGELILSKKYSRILKNEKQNLTELFENEKSVNHVKCNVFKDFLFVRDLINRYKDNKYEFRFIKRNQSQWLNMIQDGELDYEIRLAETLYELSRLRIPKKIESPFDEEFYTESGRNAFHNFTRYKFIDVFTKIVEKRENINVLDIGCGYGNYLDVLSANYPMFHIAGIESQEKVYKNTHERLKQTDVEIIHGDFFKHKFQKKYDIILLNYVLFYFNVEQKSNLLAKVKEILSENGSIIISQYFSNIEGIKKEIALKQGELSMSKMIEMFYSNKILYANTLWNDVADTFSESVKWDEFMQIIAENNLKIEHITNADRFYYSLFIELKSV